MLKRLLPRRLRVLLAGLALRLDRWLLPLAVRSAWAAVLLDLAFGAFRREQWAVAAGRAAYYRTLGAPGRSVPLLRRNTHRLEKGLVMRPRRGVFGEAYIGETVSRFGEALAGGVLEPRERRWVHDVLRAYFDVVEDTPPIATARLAFAALVRPEPVDACEASAAKAIPYRYSDLPGPPLPLTDFERLCRRRRSVRWFLPEPVPSALIDRAVEVAALAPSACNRQPFRFLVAEAPERAVALAELAGGTAGYAENLPCLVVVLGDLGAYPHVRDRHLIYIDGALAAMQFMLALDCLGLASCPINWPEVEPRERAMAEALGLAPWERPVMLIGVGYPDPDGGIPYSQKKPLELLVRRV